MRIIICCLFLLLWTGPAVAEVTLSKDTIKEEGSGYSVKVDYPLLHGAGESVDSAFNANSKKFAEQGVAEFKNDHADSAGDDPREDPPAWSLDMEFEKAFQSSRLLALEFSGYDYRGGAHGMPVIYTLTVDLSSGRKLGTKDLFKPDSAYLERLSAYCVAELGKRDILSDNDWIATGAGPVQDNYQFVVPTGEGLKVIFPAYAVAPYAAGPQTVVVPYTKVSDLLAVPLP